MYRVNRTVKSILDFQIPQECKFEEKTVARASLSHMVLYDAKFAPRDSTATQSHGKKAIQYKRKEKERVHYCIRNKTKTKSASTTEGQLVCLAVNPDVPGKLRGIRLTNATDAVTGQKCYAVEGQRCLALFVKSDKPNSRKTNEELAYPLKCSSTPRE